MLRVHLSNSISFALPFLQAATPSGPKIPPQDFEAIRRQCLAEGTLFEDPYFPADDSSLFYSQKPPRKIEWKRPKVKCSRIPLKTGSVIGSLLTRPKNSCTVLLCTPATSALGHLTRIPVLYYSVHLQHQHWGILQEFLYCTTYSVHFQHQH